MRLGPATLLLLAAACTSAPAPPVPERVEGLIVSIDGPETIRGFTLETTREERHEVRIADDISYGFDLEHLREHLALGDPVDVRLEERDGSLVALSIDDA